MLEETIQQLDNIKQSEEMQAFLSSFEPSCLDEYELSDKEKLEIANYGEEIKEIFSLVPKLPMLMEASHLIFEEDEINYIKLIIKSLYNFSAISENPSEAFPSPEKISNVYSQLKPWNVNLKKVLEEMMMDYTSLKFAKEKQKEMLSLCDKLITIEPQEADLESPKMKREESTFVLKICRTFHKMITMQIKPDVSRLMDAFSYIGKILACKQALNLDLTPTISDFLIKYPECQHDWSSCKQYIAGLDSQDIKELKENYRFSMSIQIRNKLYTLPLTITHKLKKDPHANTSAFFGGFFLEQKPSDRKLLHFFEKANDKIRIAIENLFEALCAGGYLEKRIEVLHAFVYKLTQHQAYGKEVEMKTIKWMSGNSGDINPLLYCAKEAFGINKGYKKDYFERAHAIFELDETVKWPDKPTSRMFEHSTPDIQKACNIFVKEIEKAKEQYQNKLEDYNEKAKESKKKTSAS